MSKHSHTGWLSTTDCKSFQQGLKSLFTEHLQCEQYDNLTKYFKDYSVPEITFDTVQSFSIWIIDDKQRKIWKLSTTKIEYDQIRLFGQVKDKTLPCNSNSLIHNSFALKNSHPP